ncbi:MAG: TonB-dependent receptor [Bacteroidota bacterium]
MYKRLILCGLFLAFTSLLFAQRYDLSGQVTDGESKPLGGATISLLDIPTQKVLEQVTAAEDGQFSLTADEGKYYILLAKESYKDLTLEVHLGESMDIGSLSLNPKEGKAKGGNGKYILSGMITDQQSQALKEVSVSLLDIATQKTLQSTQSGPDGLFGLTAKRGKYYILLKSPGFDNLAMEIHLTDNMDLGTLTLKVEGEGKGGKRSGSLDKYQLKGQIIDQQSAPIPYANISLTDVASQQIIGGTTTGEDGQFSIVAPEGDYYLTISNLGYKDLTMELQLGDNMETGPISLEADAIDLEGVTVSAKKPTITRKVDRLVFNIGNSLLSDGSTWAALRKAPGVFAYDSGDVLINGKSGVLVLIDNKPNFMQPEEMRDYLLSLPASEVKSIEIITNPSAMYDAEGASGIINIVMNENTTLGWKGSLNSQYKQGVYAKFNNSLSLSYKSKYFGLYSMLGKRDARYLADERNTINYPTSYWDESLERTSEIDAYSPKVSLEFYPSKSTTIGLEYTGSYSDSELDSDSRTAISPSIGRGLDSLLLTKNIGDGLSRNNNFGLFANHTFKGGIKLFTNFSHTRYSSDRAQNLSTDTFDPENEFLNNIETSLQDSEQDVTISYGKFDFIQPLKSGGTLEFGAKATSISTENGLDFFREESKNMRFDSSRSNDFNYTENIQAAYINYKRDWQKFSFQAGLRAEFTQTEGISPTTNTITENDYSKLFPSMFFLYMPSEDNQFHVAYSRRISRPQYWRLNPFRFASSPFSFIEGNPALQPTFTNNFELSFSHKYKYFFVLFLQVQEDPFTQLAVQDNETNIFRYVQRNLENSTAVGFTFNTSLTPKPWWELFANLNAYYQEDRFSSPENGSNSLIKNDVYSFDLQIHNSFNLSSKHDLSAEMQFFYYSPTVQGGFDVEDFSELSFGLRKKFWNKKASVSVFVGDVFNQNIFRMSSRFDNQDNFYRGQNENQYVRMSFRYAFGNNKVKKQKKKSEKEDELKRLQKR